MQIIVACPKCKNNILAGEGTAQYLSTFNKKEIKACGNCKAQLEISIDIKVVPTADKEKQTESAEK